MIRLEVEGYCQSCLDFEPDVTKPTRVIPIDGECFFTNTIVQCTNRKRCAGIRRYLEQQLKAEGGDTNERES